VFHKVKAKGQAEGSNLLCQQIEALHGWVAAKFYEVPVRPLGVEPYGSGRSPDDA
jgi:hypothetical protein